MRITVMEAIGDEGREMILLATAPVRRLILE